MAGIPAMVARTGYTGEDGFEVFVDTGRTAELWAILLAAVRSAGGLPVGLGARDTLRLEAGMPLYGNELDLDTNPYEAGLGRVVKLDKPGDFVGRAALEKVARDGPAAHARRPHRGGPRDRPSRVSGLGRRSTDRRGHQRDPVADARGADRDGLRRTGRRRAGYRCRRRDPRRPSAGARGRPALLQEASLSPMVPTDLRYTKDHEWVRVDGDEATVGITAYAADQLGDIVFVELPDVGRSLDQFATFGVVESVKAVSDLFAPVGGEVVETNDALAGRPELVNSEPYEGGWMVRLRLADAAQLDELLDADGLRRADRGGLTASMPYGPHTAADREKMLAALGLSSVDQLFDDIPVALRASRLDLPGPRARAGAGRPAERPGRPQPDRPGVVPGRRCLPPLEPAGGRPDPAPRRVVHGLHAVPARDQPGDPPEHLRVRIAAGRAGRPRRGVRVPLRRRGGDRRSRADDLPADPPRAGPRLARRASALSRDPADLLQRRPRARRDPARGRRRGGRHDRPRRARSGCSPSPAGRWPASSRRSRTSSGCSSRCRPSASWPTPPAPCSWRSSSRSAWPSSRHPAPMARTSRPARASRSGSRRNTAARTSASWPRPTRSSARSRAVSSG